MHAALLLVAVVVGNANGNSERKKDYPIQPVPFTHVKIQDSFWLPRLETNRKVTIPYDFRKCEETGRIDNFAAAGGLKPGTFEGIYYNDSDVFKVIEGAAYSLALHPDPKLDRYLDELIAKIAAAQEEDGYLYTARSLLPDNPPQRSGPTRWSRLSASHELYNVGHLYEAAVAHFRATGKKTLLNVAVKNAVLIAGIFGPGKRRDVPGHQEIEIGLAKLYRVTGKRKYLDLAKFFLDERGNAKGHKLYGRYSQDHLPVVEQKEAVGHAVRAVYMYCGMADVAALTGDENYIRAIDRLWENVVGKKMYLTGGIGSSRSGEAFGRDYDLPNDSAYNETCAAIAHALWNHRMFLLHGDGKYIDVLERIIYNGFLSGVSMKGDSFFYPNPLSSDGNTRFNFGRATRSPWFNCSCCPVNVVRFIPSIAGFIYAARENSVYVNLYVAGNGKITVGENEILLTQNTNYPWDGKIELTVNPQRTARFALRLRIPGWVDGRPVPSKLYRYLDRTSEGYTIKLNGRAVPIQKEKGFAVLEREWKPGDVVELDFPMTIRRVVSHDKVTVNSGHVALERGPVVYCAEGIDNNCHVRNLILADDVILHAEKKPNLLGGVTVLRGTTTAVHRAKDKDMLQTKKVSFTAVPYYAWSHRGEGEMAVWLPQTVEAANPPPLPTLASRSKPSASHCWQTDTVNTLNDLREPKSSNDHSIPRFTW